MLISEYCDPREQLEMPRMSCVYLNTPLISVCGGFCLEHLICHYERSAIEAMITCSFFSWLTTRGKGQRAIFANLSKIYKRCVFNGAQKHLADAKE